MSKLIIQNNSRLPDNEAYDYVWSVITQGKWCKWNVFEGQKIGVFVKENKKSKTIIIEDL
jgi:hypothetical protein